MSDLTNFTWPVPPSFTWGVLPDASTMSAVQRYGGSIDCQAADDFLAANLERLNAGDWPTRLAVLVPAPGPAVFRTPLSEQPGLFIRLANLQPSSANIEGFARRFGPLVGREYLIELPLAEGTSRTRHSHNETPDQQIGVDSLDLWAQEIWFLSSAVALWQATQARDLDRVESLVVWDDGAVMFPRPGRRYVSLVVPGVNRSKPFVAAERALDRFIELALQRQLQGFYRTGGPRGIELRFEHRRRAFVPQSLIGALWEQFVSAIEAGKTFRKCPARNCPKDWFEISTGQQGVREDADHCSPACRHTSYRDRKARAIALHRERKTPNEIARLLSTEEKKVKSWIATKTRK